MTDETLDDGKKAKGGKAKGGQLKQLQTEIEMLRRDLDQLQTAVQQITGTSAAPRQREISDPAQTLTAFLDAHLTEPEQENLLRTSDESVARLGYAFSSVAKVALLRALLVQANDLGATADGTTADGATARQLGLATQLSTGSLYHHLRELVHAGMLVAGERSSYALTPQGRRVLRLLLAIAS